LLVLVGNVYLWILVACVGLEYLLNDITTDGTSLAGSDIAVVALFQVNAELVGDLILHVLELSSASAVVGSHCFTSSPLIIDGIDETMSRTFWIFSS